MLQWFRNRREARLERETTQFIRNAYAGCVLMTQAQALTAATWAVNGGDEPPAPDPDLKSLFLANAIALGYGPRVADQNARSLWQLLALELDVSSTADYPSIANYSLNSEAYIHRGNIPPGYEFLAALTVNEIDARMFTKELLNLAVAHRDDMPTMFLQQLSVHFGEEEPDNLRNSFKKLPLHAGFTMKTVAEDVEESPEEEENQRLELASAFEGRMLALAKRVTDTSESWGARGAYGVEE